MAYCVLADVLEMFPEITSLDTDAEGLTDARVTSNLIPEADAAINAALRGANYGTVPVVDTDDTPLLRAISKRLVAAEVHDIIYETHADITQGATAMASPATRWRTEAAAQLEAIVDGSLELDTARSATLDIGVFEDYQELTTAESEEEMVPALQRAEPF
tara:strand:- start:3223 stop:3702 length:480 start_codon:yes stop_codon:yes gene_type:complete